MKRIAGVLLAAALMAGGTPAVGSTDPAPEPSTAALSRDMLQITGCSIEYGTFRGTLDKLHVSFINHADEPITHIRFGLKVDFFPTIAVMDVGTFAPGKEIHHDLDPPLTTVSTNVQNLGCFVDAFTLKDGSTWVSPQLQAQLQNRKP